MNCTPRTWIAALVLSLGPVAALAQGSHEMPMSHSGSMGAMKSMKSLEAAKGKTFDIHWMSQMIAHHKVALEMADIALQGGKNANVRRAARDIVRVQSAEIGTMTSWLKSWYNTAPDAKQMKLMNDDMKPMLLAARGGMDGMVMGNVDRNFLEQMIPHHQSAVDMAKLALEKAARSELKRFARGVISVQSREIAQYRVWLKGLK